MKSLEKYEFTNEKAFETVYLTSADTQELGVAECDSIALLRHYPDHTKTLAMRPDEALILARMLVNAVHQTCSGFEVQPPV